VPGGQRRAVCVTDMRVASTGISSCASCPLPAVAPHRPSLCRTEGGESKPLTPTKTLVGVQPCRTKPRPGGSSPGVPHGVSGQDAYRIARGSRGLADLTSGALPAAPKVRCWYSPGRIDVPQAAPRRGAKGSPSPPQFHKWAGDASKARSQSQMPCARASVRNGPRCHPHSGSPIAPTWRC